MSISIKQECQVEFLRWLAGFWDADGCFSISLAKQRTANNYLAVKPVVSVGQRGDHEWIIKYIYKKLGFGRTYLINRGTVISKATWQTTTISDSIKIAKMLEPYLLLKKEKAHRFIEALELWGKSGHISDWRRRSAGKPVRSKEDVLKVVKIATTLNEDRQEKRYRKYKRYKEWKKIIDKWYSEN